MIEKAHLANEFRLQMILNTYASQREYDNCPIASKTRRPGIAGRVSEMLRLSWYIILLASPPWTKYLTSTESATHFLSLQFTFLGMKVSIIPTLVAALSALVAAVPTSSETGNHLDRRITFNDNVFLYPGGLGDPLNSYLGSLPYAKVVNVGWNYYFDKTVPKRCKEKALGKKSDGSVMCPLANLDVWEFFWADAPDLGHVICRCNDSPVTVDVCIFISLLSYIHHFRKLLS